MNPELLVPRVRQLRLVVLAEDLEEALACYRDALGMPVEAEYSDGPAWVIILDAGRATLELVNAEQRDLIDEVEVGHAAAGPIRVAFEVENTPSAVARMTHTGARLVADARRTPWGSLNARLDAPAKLHVTVFQETESGSET